MEVADVETLFADPKHPYTVGLMSSIPVLGIGKRQRRLSTIPGVVPSLFSLEAGCLFHDRCADVFEPCDRVAPPMVGFGNGHLVRCHKYG
jgi:peptide/nickel transport system ATP-binding protein